MIVLRAPAHREYAKRMIDEAPVGHVVTIKEGTRTTDQNAKLWAMLGDVSRQIEWHGLKLSPDDWKDVFTAGLRKARVVPNMEGNGFVALGLRTSTMTKRELSDLIELMFAFGAERGVKWTELERAA